MLGPIPLQELLLPRLHRAATEPRLPRLYRSVSLSLVVARTEGEGCPVLQTATCGTKADQAYERARAR